MSNIQCPANECYAEMYRKHLEERGKEIAALLTTFREVYQSLSPGGCVEFDLLERARVLLYERP